jgi:SAM-dependent methyltransferase
MSQIRRMGRNVRVAVRRALKLDDHGQIFNRIYTDSAWKTGSGPGSTEEDTRPYREFLQAFLRDHAITSVADLGCGDWQFSKLMDWSGIDYTGMDVSTVALDIARKNSGGAHRFIHLNGASDDLPKADLLLAKDVLQHLSIQDIQGVLSRLNGYKFALLTNGYPPRQSRMVNSNIQPGERSRPLDFTAPPFNLKGRIVFRYTGHEPKETFLWSRDAQG